MTHLDKVSKIIDLIYAKTSSRDLQWSIYSSATDITTQIAGRPILLSRTDDSFGETHYKIRFYNEDGKMVEEYDDYELAELSPSQGFHDYYSLFADLYQQAYSIAKGIDVHLDAILSELSDDRDPLNDL